MAFSSPSDPTTQAKSRLKDHQVLHAGSVDIFTIFEYLLAKGTFDIIYVSTPHPLGALHYLHVRTALDNKHNMGLEKLATMNREQYQKLVSLPEKRDVKLMKAIWT